MDPISGTPWRYRDELPPSHQSCIPVAGILQVREGPA